MGPELHPVYAPVSAEGFKQFVRKIHKPVKGGFPWWQQGRKQIGEGIAVDDGFPEAREVFKPYDLCGGECAGLDDLVGGLW